METRISSKVKITVEAPEEPVMVLMNQALFAWVVENLCKNAVDAMEGQGNITFHIEEKGKKVRIRLPKDKLNKEDVVVPVCINGYTYQIKRGEWVDVPEEVARILEEAGYMG